MFVENIEELRYEMEKLDKLIQNTEQEKERFQLITNRLKLSREFNKLNKSEGRTMNEREQAR